MLAALQHPSNLAPAALVPALRSALAGLQASAAASNASNGNGAHLATAPPPQLLRFLSAAAGQLGASGVADLGAEAPLLLLEALDALNRSAGICSGRQEEEQEGATLWAHAHVALGDAASWHVLSTTHLCRYYEVVARCPLAGAPSKGRGLGLALREHLQKK